MLNKIDNLGINWGIARAKALLQAKVIVSDSLSNSLIKSENQKVKEDMKNGVVREYSSNETNQIFETSLSNYKIVYDKTFVQSGKYRSYIVIELEIGFSTKINLVLSLANFST